MSSPQSIADRMISQLVTSPIWDRGCEAYKHIDGGKQVDADRDALVRHVRQIGDSAGKHCETPEQIAWFEETATAFVERWLKRFDRVYAAAQRRDWTKAEKHRGNWQMVMSDDAVKVSSAAWRNRTPEQVDRQRLAEVLEGITRDLAVIAKIQAGGTVVFADRSSFRSSIQRHISAAWLLCRTDHTPWETAIEHLRAEQERLGVVAFKPDAKIWQNPISEAAR